jgi:glycosyltransferase involved in cell wall biosynthesis
MTNWLPSMTRSPRQIRVVHIVPSSFGHHFSGHTHYLFSLLSGWRDRDIVLDLWGTSMKPTNICSGNLEYQLPGGKNLWDLSEAPTRPGTLRHATGLLSMLVSRRACFDIAHFHTLGWGELLSPRILHSLGKKAVYTLSLYGSGNPSAIAQGAKGAIRIRLFRSFDGMVALSPALVADCGAYGISGTICLPNFLALPELMSVRNPELRTAFRSRHRILPDDPVLLFVGSAIQRKGLDTLVEVFLRIAQTSPRARLIVVGPYRKNEGLDIDPCFVEEQQARLECAHLSERVTWTGTVNDRRELVGYCSAADMFVFPTRREGFPNVLAEAMAAGLPIVTSNLPGVTDSVIADGENGFLAPLDDASAIGAVVGELISNPSLRARVGASAHARSRLFGFEHYCERLKEFYLRVMGSRLDACSPGPREDANQHP